MSFTTEVDQPPTLPVVRIQEIAFETTLNGWQQALSVTGSGLLFDMGTLGAAWSDVRVTIDGNQSGIITDEPAASGTSYWALFAKFDFSLLIEVRKDDSFRSRAEVTAKYGTA